MPPFQSASPRELLNLQCTAGPPPLPDEVRAGLPRGVEQLLFQLLEKAPEDRPYLAQDVVDRLEPFQTAAAPAKSGGRTSAPSRTSVVTPHATPASSEPRTPTPASPRLRALTAGSGAESGRRRRGRARLRRRGRGVRRHHGGA